MGKAVFILKRDPELHDFYVLQLIFPLDSSYCRYLRADLRENFSWLIEC